MQGVDSPQGSEGPLPSTEEVIACQISSWYDLFSNLPTNELGRSNVTIKSKIIDLPPSFRDYLLADGLNLPEGAQSSSCMLSGNNEDTDAWSSDDDSVRSNENYEGENAQSGPSFAFPELNDSIQDAINVLGGSVCPKLNWSAPKDATWVNSGTMLCKSPGDIYLLVKSSDFCCYDVQHALTEVISDENVPSSDMTTAAAAAANETASAFRLQLAIRKWCNLNPSQEFRCFVRGKRLIAISQRQHSQHFPHLSEDVDLYQPLLEDFFEEIIRDNFSLPNYVFDCYIDKKERVWLVDINVWASRTDALLFTWSELTNGDAAFDSKLQFRVVTMAKEVRADPLASYRAPIDTVHVASMIGGDATKFKEFMSLCRRPTALESEESRTL